MGDFAKAFGGYTETAHGWVDNSDNKNKSPQPMHLDVFADADFVNGVVEMPYTPFPSFSVNGYNVSKRSTSKGWYVTLGISHYIDLPNVTDFIKVISLEETDALNPNPRVFQISRGIVDAIEDLKNSPLPRGLFAGEKLADVIDFLDGFERSIRDSLAIYLKIGSDFLSEDYKEHMSRLSKMQLTANTYISDIVMFMIYTDPKGALQMGNKVLTEKAREIKKSL